MALALRSLAALLLVAAANAQIYSFCTDGISKADFDAKLPIEVIFAQAPLFSTNPKIGDKLEKLGLFHSAIVFAQGANDTRKYWTLEFDFTGGSLLTAIVPQISVNLSAPGGYTMTWNNDARYCLENGLKWGEKHWSKHFDVVTTASAQQMEDVFAGFVTPFNSTNHDTFPQYQLWRVERTGWFGFGQKVMIPDVTCNSGAVWFLHHLMSRQGAHFPPHFAFEGTAVLLKAHSVEPVNTTDPVQMQRMVHFFQQVSKMVAANTSIPHRLLDVMEIVVERKFVYDANAQKYYELIDSFAPWMEFAYVEFPLERPFMKYHPARTEVTIV